VLFVDAMGVIVMGDSAKKEKDSIRFSAINEKIRFDSLQAINQHKVANIMPEL